MTKKICVWLVLLSIIVTCALAQQPNSLSTSQPDLSAVTIQAPFGYWYPSSFFTETPGVQLSTSYQGIMVIATNSPIKIGHFDKNGKVVNGDYVMVFYADLDTAPISKLWFNNFGWLSIEQPVVSGIPSNLDGQLFGSALEVRIGATNVATQIWGTQGTAYVGVALLTRANQNLDKAWGATVSQVIRIDDSITGFPYGNFIHSADGNVTYTTASFTIGGAARFKKH